MEEAKNFPLLLQAFKLIKERSNAKLLIAGNGSLKVSLENFANELEVSEDVEFLGFVENPYELFCKADVFVLSSSWEGLGNVIIEALACGCQVVSTDCPGGPAEILENGKYGRLVPVGNARALADAMLEAYRKPFPKEMLMKRAEDFDEEVIGHQYIQLAEEILANAP